MMEDAIQFLATAQMPSEAKQAAETGSTEGDGGFNPRARSIKSVVALATEGCISPVLPENTSFSAAHKVSVVLAAFAAGLKPCTFKALLHAEVYHV
jgi:hypothetical protein